MKILPIGFLLLFLVVMQGCGAKKLATGVIADISTDGIVALESEEDVGFARESALPLIKTLEVLRYGNTKNVKALVLLSQSYGQYAFGFIEEEILLNAGKDAELANLKKRADLFYRRGRDCGLEALSVRLGSKKVFESPLQDFKKAIAKLGKADVPALFWTAFNWAGYLNLHLDDPQEIANLPHLQALLDHVLELNPNFYNGSAHALKGVLLVTRPRMLGGDPVKAEKEFAVAIEVAPNYLMTKVLFAQYYARQLQDADLFRKTLTEVQNADAAALPAQRLANELAKRRAGLLLNMQKKMF